MKTLCRTAVAFNLVPPALQVKATGEILRNTRKHTRVSIKVRCAPVGNGLLASNWNSKFAVSVSAVATPGLERFKVGEIAI